MVVMSFMSPVLIPMSPVIVFVIGRTDMCLGCMLCGVMFAVSVLPCHLLLFSLNSASKINGIVAEMVQGTEGGGNAGKRKNNGPCPDRGQGPLHSHSCLRRCAFGVYNARIRERNQSFWVNSSSRVLRLGSPISCSSYCTRTDFFLNLATRLRSIGVPMTTRSQGTLLMVAVRSLICWSP